MAYTALVPVGHARPFVVGDKWKAVEHAEVTAEDLANHETRILALEGGGVFAQTYLTITDIANAAIITLPSTPVTVVANAGSGYAVRVLDCALYAKFAAAAYTGISATACYLSLSAANSVNESIGIANDSSTTPAITQATHFFNGTNKRVMLEKYLVSVPVASASGYILTQEPDGTFPADLFTDLNNTGVALALDNNGSSTPLGGGNTANKIRVFTYWVKEQLP